MAKKRYKVEFPFSNGEWYISISFGRKFHNWLKVHEVPKGLLRLVDNADSRWDSVRCISRQKARELVWALEREVAE